MNIIMLTSVIILDWGRDYFESLPRVSQLYADPRTNLYPELDLASFELAGEILATM